MAYKVLFTSGKGEFVQRTLADGKVEKVCLHTFNADLSFGGCVAQIPTPELAAEAFLNSGKYKPETLRDCRAKGVCLDARCDYCYARSSGRGNWGKVTTRVVDESTEALFEEHRPKYLRLGKSTEVGHPYYIPELVKLIEMCNKYGTKIIFPNKMFPCGIEGLADIPLPASIKSQVPRAQKLVELLNANGGILSYSFCDDFSERGCVAQGFSNEWRLRQAEEFHKRGLKNLAKTVVCDVTVSLQENVRGGNFINNVLASNANFDIPVRIIPLRLTSRSVAERITGVRWEELFQKSKPFLGQENLAIDLSGVDEPVRFTQRRNNDLIANYLHPDFQELFEMGAVSFCGAIAGIEYCDKCLLEPAVSFPQSEIVPVTLVKTGKAIGRRKKKDNHPTLLGFN